MTEDRERELLRLAEAVSDGAPVDWDQERGSHPGMKEPLEHMALLDRVRRVHEESSRVLIAVDAKARREEAAGGESLGTRPRPSARWLAIALILAAAALAFVLYKSATKAAM
jgi:hypothetical protein